MLFLHRLVQTANDLLSVNMEQFAFSRTLYKHNHTACTLFLSGFLHSTVIWDSSLMLYRYIHSFKNSFIVMSFTCHKIHLSVEFNDFKYTYRVVQTSPKSNCRTLSSPPKEPYAHLQSLPFPPQL